ncbi:CinA family protein [Microbacterium sp. LWO12-1.2]|uniref:CinA family protein n=1 Tax=Microbacterium sp. LWO12-1.2 TaxID=3135261 RepID=UPI0039C9D5A9
MTTANAAALLEVLRARALSLGVAESLTGGAIAAEIVSVPGASDVFRGGIVAYATPVKHTLLGVDAELLEEHGPVHPQVALQMADGVRRALSVAGFPADVGIATTGIAGPDSPDGQPVGTVHIGVVAPGSRSPECSSSRGTGRPFASSRSTPRSRPRWPCSGNSSHRIAVVDGVRLTPRPLSRSFTTKPQRETVDLMESGRVRLAIPRRIPGMAMERGF